ncbi:MAG: hypothetical protein JW724_05125 [Candidatus Altiarchaeota archaeon]|nr:hypothetical protein [Candidatus Altiarchaeota archaeon]
MMIKILQLLPAKNWWAVYDDDGEPFISRLVCWALVQVGNEEVDRSVTGMDIDEEGRVEFCQEIENFRNYVYAKTKEEAMKEVEDEQ